MKFILLAVLLALQVENAGAQRVCGTDTYKLDHYKKTLRQSTENFRIPPRDTVPNEIITIPVVVHVVFNTSLQNISTDQVLSQIEVLNQDYRKLNKDNALVPDAFKAFAGDTRIMFCLAQVDPEGRATNGINRRYTSKPYFNADDGMKFKASGGVDAWDPDQYLNIWVCSIFGRVLGYAAPPGGELKKDGVVINYDVFGSRGSLQRDFNKGRTTTHEVAHWLGLQHIWGDDFCGDDGIDDTPRQKSYNFNCPSFPRKTDCSPNDNGDMFMNFMDLTSDACMNMFTHGQKNKMRSYFALGAARNALLRSNRCDASMASAGPLPDDTIPKKQQPDVISVYPNPVVSDITIHSKDSKTLIGKTATIRNNAGVAVLTKTLKGGDEKLNVDMLKPGFYILTIEDNAEKLNFKIIKL